MSDEPTDAERRLARRTARIAVRNGRPVSVCPYDPNGATRHRLLALEFVREYRRHQPSTTDYTT
ncbi:hypothetical protein [Stackebrandtia soli]|uniref:hypothetical protein n=1 Tax=Stackebrandtia soli TaxID=1892856 RepID=UPI0039EBC2A4